MRKYLLPVALCLLACARMVAPGGGPEDEEPPEITEIIPPSGTGYTDLDRVAIRWSERLEEESFLVFVYPPVDYSTDVSGSKTEIIFSDPVGPEPLVIHLSGLISDRRGNRWGRSMDLVYTASDSLPEGAIRVGLSRQGGGSLSPVTLVELYRDSALVRRTNADSSGGALIAWLDPGDYRLICYEDPDRSFLWDAEREAGFDTVLTLVSGDTLSILSTMTVVDTVGPILTEVSVMDSYHFQMTFNEEVSYESFGMGDVSVEDSLGENLDVNGYWLTGGTASAAVVLETVRLPDEPLKVTLEGIHDLMENPCRRDSMEFWGIDSIPSDSFRIRSFYPAPGSDNADPGGPFLISFNYWAHPDSLQNRLHLNRVVDSTAVVGSLRVVDGRSFEFYPEHQLIGEQQYRFLLEPGLHTLWGDTLSLPFSWSFSTLWGDEPGSIAGSITGYGSGETVLQIRRTGGDTQAEATYTAVNTGLYQVDEVPAGRYTVAAFIDGNGDGTWNGQEPYGTYPGVILVQPGLITRDIDIEILP
jgi:hypothetical protein